MVSFQAIYLFMLLVFIVIVQGRNSDDIKRMKGLRLTDEERSNTFRNYIAQAQNKSSTKSTSTRATLHQCIAPCLAEYSFSSALTLPINCYARVQAYTCWMEILVWYDLREYELLFFSNSIDTDPGNLPFTSIASKSVSLRYGNPLTKFYSILFACYDGDNCEWNYARQVVNKIISNNYEPVQNDLSSSLYTSFGNSVSRCYQGNSPVSCYGGICSSFFDVNSSWNRTCSFLSSPVVGIDINSIRVVPDSSLYNDDSVVYACNRDLCNSPSSESTIKSTITKYSSLLESFG